MAHRLPCINLVTTTNYYAMSVFRLTPFIVFRLQSVNTCHRSCWCSWWEQQTFICQSDSFPIVMRLCGIDIFIWSSFKCQRWLVWGYRVHVVRTRDVHDLFYQKKYLFYVREDDEEECCIFMERGPLEAYLHYLHIVDNNTQVYMRTWHKLTILQQVPRDDVKWHAGI